MTKLYVAQIPKHFKVSRGTLYRDIRKGRISAETNDKGRTLVDLSELERVYQPRQKEDVSQAASPAHYETDDSVHGNSTLRREVELLRERLAENATVLDDLRSERDRLISLIEEQATTVKLLTDERQKEPKPKRRWWRHS